MVWPSSTSICSPIGSIVTVWLIALPSESSAGNAVKARRGYRQHALVIDAVVLEAGIDIWRKRLVIQQPLRVQEIRFCSFRMRRSGWFHDVLNQGLEGHLRLHQQSKRRTEHQMVRPEHVQQLHAIEVLDLVFRFKLVVV